MRDVRSFRIKNRWGRFVGPEKTSYLWRLVENEVYEERLEFRRWYLTFAKHNACISEGGPSCRVLTVEAEWFRFESRYKRGPSNRQGPLLSSTASVYRLDCVSARAKLTASRSH